MLEVWRKFPDRILVYGTRTYTNSEALGQVHHRVTQLHSSGVLPGDTVAAAVRPSSDFFFWLTAMIMHGVRLLVLNPALPSEQADTALAAVGPQWELGGTPLKITRSVGVSSLAHGAAPAEGFQLLLQTSGTTGTPKTVPLRWNQLRTHALASERHLALRRDDVWAACLPVHHIGGLSILFRCMVLGCGVWIDRAMDAVAMNARIDDGTVTHISVVPTLLKRLLDSRADRPFPPSLRMILVGGAALPGPLAERARAVKAPLAPTYGMTETSSQICTLPPKRFLAGENGCGGPTPGTEVRLGGEGEIFVRGPSVMRGYLGFPGVADWFETDDVGVWKEGSLHILDRRTDLIISGGENVYPSQVEAILAAFRPGTDCAVIGLSDETWGQRVVAVFEANSIDESELRAFCQARLAPHQVPKAFVALPRIPRTASGKIQRARLRAELMKAS